MQLPLIISIISSVIIWCIILTFENLESPCFVFFFFYLKSDLNVKMVADEFLFDQLIIAALNKCRKTPTGFSL